jgi:hypothetical protein
MQIKILKSTVSPSVSLLIPTARLFGKGHPATRNLEEDINNLLAGKVLAVQTSEVV